MIFLIDSTSEVTPAYSTMIAITVALKYSARPCPRGCLRSGDLCASFVPMMVISEESASLKLFTASSMTDTEEEISPTAALNDARNTLAAMPIRLVLTIVRFLFSVCTIILASKRIFGNYITFKAG